MRTPAELERALADAHAALDAAATRSAVALNTWDDARTDAQERRAQLAWENAHAEQNRAAQRLHAANRALGRPPRDDRRPGARPTTVAERAYELRA
jgi:hypothetical protein